MKNSGRTRGKFRVYADYRDKLARETMYIMYTRYVKEIGEREREEKRARSGSRSSSGSICEHVTHMERPL